VFWVRGRFREFFRRKYLGIVTVAPDQILLPSEFPLAHHRLKMNVITSIGVLLALLAIIGMFATALAFNRLQPSRPPSRGDLRRFLALRRELDALPAITELLIGMATLAAKGLRGAVLAANNQPYFKQHPNEHLEYAPDYVLAYGLFFSALLAFAFAPSFLTMRAAGARLRERDLPLPAPADLEFADMVARRNALDDVLQTSLTATSTSKAAVAILTPLAGSLVSLVLPAT
jgi:hypothetical protein